MAEGLLGRSGSDLPINACQMIKTLTHWLLGDLNERVIAGNGLLPNRLMAQSHYLH